MILNIVDITDDGRGIGKTSDNLTIFVDSCLPGDTVEVEIYKYNKNFAEAKLLKIIEKSTDRIYNKCNTPQECGGCDFISYSYDAQLKLKKKKVENSLMRIAGLQNIKVEDIIFTKNIYNYRNKVSLQVEKDNIGYFSKNTNDIVNMKDCSINSKISIEIKDHIKENIKILRIKGLKKIIIRNCKNDEEIMVVFESSIKDNREKIRALVESLCKKYPNIKSVLLQINNNEEILYGKGYISDHIKEYKFKISSRTFFQINPYITEIMYEKIVEFLDIKDTDVVCDLYCGIGTITMFLANKAKKVIAIEYFEQSINNAKENAEKNKIDNIEFVCGKAEKIFPKISKKNKIDKIVLDPPRKGCDKRTIKSIIEVQPQKIVYVSCNPSTLARDLKRFIESGYKLDIVQPLDMFPMTTHVETVVLLSLK